MQAPEKIENADQAEQALDYVLEQPFVPLEVGGEAPQLVIGAFSEYAADAEKDLLSIAFNKENRV